MQTEKRTNRIKIQLSDSEKATLEAAAREANCSVTELVRATLVHHTIDVPKIGKRTARLIRTEQDERTEYVFVRLTSAEKQVLKTRAEALGCTLSELVRRVATHGEITATNFNSALLRQQIHELKKQGVNLNQLMYFLNKYGIKGYEPKHVSRTLDKVYQAIEDTSALIKKIETEFLG